MAFDLAIPFSIADAKVGFDASPTEQSPQIEGARKAHSVKTSGSSHHAQRATGAQYPELRVGGFGHTGREASQPRLGFRDPREAEGDDYEYRETEGFEREDFSGTVERKEDADTREESQSEDGSIVALTARKLFASADVCGPTGTPGPRRRLRFARSGYWKYGRSQFRCPGVFRRDGRSCV